MEHTKYSARKFTSDEVAAFCEQVMILLNGGIPLHEGTYILCSEVEDKKSSGILRKVNELVERNVPFYQALEETGAFPEYMIEMVHIGEMTGKLEEVMESLSLYYKRESSMKSNIWRVVSYPVMLFVMMGVLLLILAIKILPMFQTVFQELSADAAVSSSNMMSFGLNAGRAAAVLVSMFLVLILGVFIWYRTESGKKAVSGFLRQFILTRKLNEKLALGKFISAMSLMTASGMDTKEALAMAESVAGHPGMKQKIRICSEMAADGKALDEILKTAGLVSGMQERMIHVGAKTGSMDLVLSKLGRYYDEEIENRLNRLSSSVETILVIILSILVGAILVSVMLPMVSIISSIG